MPNGTFEQKKIQKNNNGIYTNVVFDNIYIYGNYTVKVESIIDDSIIGEADDSGYDVGDYNPPSEEVEPGGGGSGDGDSGGGDSGDGDSGGANSFRYFRIQAVDSDGSILPDTTQAWLNISDIKLFDNSNVEYPTTDLTSNTSEAGITISAGAFHSDGYAPYKAFDNTGTSFWWV